MNNGWVKLHRKILDNPIIMKNSNYLAVWTYCLLKAAHSDKDIIFKGKRKTLKPGEFSTGRKDISKDLNISESMIQRILKTFENEQQIEQQTDTKCRIIGLKNWCNYQIIEQQNEQQVNNKGTTSEQQVNTKQEYNNIIIKEDKKIISKDIIKKITLQEKIKEEFLNNFINDVYKKYNLTESEFKSSCEDFVLYWTEKNENGKKERWEMQKVFNTKMRFITWIKRSSQYKNKTKQNKSYKIYSI